MKRGFIRGLWGIFDNSHRIKARRFRVENNIKATLSNKYSPESQTYVFGKENYEGLINLGVQNVKLINEEAFQFDLVKPKSSSSAISTLSISSSHPASNAKRLSAII